MSELESEIGIEVLAASEVRRSLTNENDIRDSIAFQNDVNALLARVEQMQMPWRSLSDLEPAPLSSAIVAEMTPLPVAVRPRIGRLAPLVVARPVNVARRS
jgi:hypothetical protein